MKEKIKVAFAHNHINHNTEGIMAGITDYMRDRGDWQLIIWTDNSLESLEFLKQRGCKGAFVSILTSTKAQQLLQIGMPMIALSALQNMLNLPYISADAAQTAKVAYDYLSSKNYRNFAFFGLTEARWSQERMQHFSHFVSSAGGKLHVYEGEHKSITDELIPFAKLWIDMTLNKGQQELVKWLKQLPKPVAVLASCDILGCHLSNVTNEAGFKIPDEVAILGINNDSAICNLCDPPLSSIAFNLKKAGYEAAQLMDNMISGKQTLQGQRINIQTAFVKSRGSTDIFAIEDPDVVMALKYIQTNSAQPLQVEDVARHVCISKRSLQMKFQKALGKSVHDEIVRAHFETAKSLLIETNLSISNIAVRSGFHYTTNMRRAFKDLTGMLPHRFRQTHRSS